MRNKFKKLKKWYRDYNQEIQIALVIVAIGFLGNNGIAVGMGIGIIMGLSINKGA